jgi:hypothetical protein
MAQPAWKMACTFVADGLPKMVLKQSAQISQVQRHYKRTMAMKSRLARMVELNRLRTGSFYDPALPVVGYDNSGSSFRFSGSQAGAGSAAKSGLYLGTQASTGMFPTVTTEMAYYSQPKPSYHRLLSGSSSKQEQLTYFDPSVLLPKSKAVMVYTTKPGIEYWDCSEGLPELEFVIREELKRLRENLSCIVKDAPPQVVEEYVTPEMIWELRKSSSGSAFPLSCALSMPKYSISAPLGTICLQSNTGVLFPSARDSVVPVREYMGGAKNIVLPMNCGIQLPLTPETLYTFDAGKLEGVKLFDSNGKPIKITL